MLNENDIFDFDDLLKPAKEGIPLFQLRISLITNHRLLNLLFKHFIKNKAFKQEA